MSVSLNKYQERITQVVARIRQSEAQGAQQAPNSSGWSRKTVKLIAVSKTFPAHTIAAIATCGLTNFGENYVQEGVEKILSLKEQNINDLVWHFIGPIQSNKTRLIAEHFDWVQSIDKIKIAERLSQQRPKNLPPLQILLQVNISAESTKRGFIPSEIPNAVASIRQLPQITLRGLMAIPAPADNFEEQRVPFRAMKILFDQIKASEPQFDTLSLGMSDDFEAAIQEGSTMVRIGHAIFGARI